MRIETLEMFVKLVELGSYSHVADRLDLTQPAVTMQIKAFEDHFDTKLVIKDKGKINLTPSGRVIYNRAKKILENWETIEKKVEQYAGTVYGEFKIGASTIPSVYILPKKLKVFSEEYPQVKIIMKIGDSREILRKIDEGDLSAGVIGFRPSAKKYKVRVIAEDLLVLIVPNKSTLVNKKDIELNDLFDENLLLRENGSGTRKAFREGLNRLGINTLSGFNIQACLGSTEAILAAVESGLGISFVSSLAAQEAIKYNRVKKVDVRDFSVSRNFYFVYHKAKGDGVLIKEFNNCL